MYTRLTTSGAPRYRPRPQPRIARLRPDASPCSTPRPLTRAEQVCRSQLDPIVSFLRQYVPGFAHCHLISSAAVMGVRETRHFQGDYALAEQDILEARLFEDRAVTKANFSFDIHSLTDSGLDEAGVQARFAQARGLTIPYRCLLPKGVGNQLLAGRSISGAHLAHSNDRVTPICANMGQAVGIAAALSVKQGCSPRTLKTGDPQTVLRAQGVAP